MNYWNNFEQPLLNYLDSITFPAPSLQVIPVIQQRPLFAPGPLSWAYSSTRLLAELEKSLGDEAAGPIAQLIPYPTDGGDGGEDDNLAALKRDIATKRGKALLVETTAAGLGEGRSAAPARDWVASRLGPHPPESLATIRKDAFQGVLAACGCSPALFDDSDGTSKREALRQWHLGTVLPLSKMLEHELSMKMETTVRLRFDNYAMDMVSRAQVVEKLVAAGVPLATAMSAVGMMEG